MAHKQVIVLRKDLNMRKGKMVAQGAHASLAAILNLGRRDDDEQITTIPLNNWATSRLTGRFAKICVYVTSEAALLDVYRRAKESGLMAALIQDAGLTEFGGIPTFTAVAIGPDRPDRIDPITGHLPLL